MKKLVAMVFFAMVAGNAVAQAGGSAEGAGAGAGAAAGVSAGTIATVAVAVVGIAGPLQVVVVVTTRRRTTERTLDRNTCRALPGPPGRVLSFLESPRERTLT